MPDRKRRGRYTEEAVAQYLRENGWPDAERCPPGEGGKDVRRTPNIAPEVKGRNGFEPLAWMRQAKRNAGPAELPFVVMRPNGSGEGDVADWPAILPFADLVKLLNAAGLAPEGTPTP